VRASSLAVGEVAGMMTEAEFANLAVLQIVFGKEVTLWPFGTALQKLAAGVKC
jgi:hypothetical protein